MALGIRNILARLQGCSSRALRFNSTITVLSGDSESVEDNSVEPIISRKKYPGEEHFFVKPRELWIENLDTIESKKLGLVTLHPDVFAAPPRVDLIHKNVQWQRMYRYVSYAHSKTRAEVRGGGRKPWPQKGTGRARHGSIRSPLWRGGGVVHGPRSHKTYFYMLPFFVRVAGLTSTLSVKLAQDDLFIVDNLDIPTQDSAYMEELIEARNWGPSVLFIDTDDIMPINITMATDEIQHVNMMPSYGLNVYSMLKHTTLVLTERAARSIEEKLLFQLNRSDSKTKIQKYKLDQ